MQISGVVATGKRIGRTLGFPTANILPDEGSVLPKQNGVYAAVLTLEDGRALPCVLNKGRHPTLPEGAATVEAFIFDFAGDLYGQRVRVDFRAFLRPETRFSGKDELRAQISDAGERAGLGPLTPADQHGPSGAGPAQYWRFAGARGTVGFISAMSNHFCSRCNRLRLTADGKLRPCLFSDDEYPVRDALRAGDDEQVLTIYRDAIAHKPQEHKTTDGTARFMSQIGG